MYGIADLKTGKMIVPAEYTTIDVLSDGRFLLTRYENQAASFYYADASGTVTPIQTPVKGTYFGMEGDDCFFIGVYAKHPLTAAVQQPAEQYDIPTLVLLDENMKVIRDDIDGACGAASTPHFTNGLMPIQTSSTLRFDLNSYYGGLHCGECFDVFVRGKWKPTRIEYGDNWYLVGIRAEDLNGLRVRI